jgi:hypothetical protein
LLFDLNTKAYNSPKHQSTSDLGPSAFMPFRVRRRDTPFAIWSGNACVMAKLHFLATELFDLGYPISGQQFF